MNGGIESRTNMQKSLRLNGGTVKNHSDTLYGYVRAVKTTGAWPVFLIPCSWTARESSSVANGSLSTDDV